MAIQTMVLDPNVQSYANLADLDPAAASYLASIEPGAQVNPANLAALDSTAATKLAGIEAGATGDQTGSEIRDLIVALADTDRKIVITNPTTGQFKVVSVQKQADGKFGITFDDVAV